MPCVGKRLAQPLADQFLHRPVGNRHQVHVALVLGLNALGKKLAQARARLARNLRGLGNPYQISDSAGHRRRSRGFLVRRLAQRAGPIRDSVKRGARRLPASLMVRIWCL